MALTKIGGLWKGKEGSKAIYSGELQLEGRGGPKIRILVFHGKSENPKAPLYEICRADDDPSKEPF